jgi:hypothetical protein
VGTVIPTPLFWLVIREIQETLADYEALHRYKPEMWTWVWMEFVYVNIPDWTVEQTDFVAGV